ncbi:hypothetical protein C7S20_12700 [Christiangramia fulva]|uniref:Lipoprotein n=1 Tax=Christiangramia fulva TaxID=2126553 RepID=A0A2R3Z740_9FLAO|nr:hypothetical protein [Christiangramia fulva]AVR46044.1 hypothetical protein C7S20_12700 [Christiangramia fulva]
MRKIFLLVIVLLLGCKNTENELHSKFPDYELKKINFLEKEFYIPGNYFDASKDSIFQQRLATTDTIDKLSLNHRKYLQLINSGVQFEYFVDKDNPQNSIIFILGQHISLNEKTMYKYIDMLKMTSFKDDKEDSTEYKLLEKEFYKPIYADIIKVKFKRIKKGKELYLTQYLVTQGLKTITMIVMNTENKDFDQIIKNFKS